MPGDPAVPEGIWIHEDDWGMRCLHPIAARGEVEQDLEESIAAAERNRAPGGMGWTDIHVIRSPSITYADAGLALDCAADRLAGIMPRVRSFHAGISSSPDDPWASHEEDAWCFGLDASCFVKLEPKGDLVERIWYELHSRDPEPVSALRRAIEAIDSLVPSLLVDHWMKMDGPVADRSFLDAYFAAHRAQLLAAEERAKSWAAEWDGMTRPEVPRR